MRIISEAYQHLGQLIKETILDDNGRPAFHWADLWYEQTEFPDLAEAIDYPAVFFDFASDDIKTLGQLEQDISLLTDLYVAVDTLQDTAIGSPETPGGLHFLELCARVQEKLQAYDHPSCGNLTRIGFSRFSARTNVIVYRLTYRSQVVDTSATDVRRNRVPPPPGALTMGDRHTPPTNPISRPPVFDL